MLVLTRRSGESLRIGADVRVTVLESSGGHVRLGIEAPTAVAVHREEVWERIARANREAAAVTEEGFAAWLAGTEAEEGSGG